LADSKLPGLRLRITPAGAKTWVLGCRDTHGRARRFPLGRYPDQGIADARKAARSVREKIAAGADPIAEGRRKRKATKDATAGIGTLAALLEVYEAQAAKGMRSWPECRRRIESVFGKHLKAALSATERTDLQMTADNWPSAQSAAAAVRYVRPVLKWGAQRQYAPAGLAGLVPPTTVGRRKRILSRDELAAVLPALRASDRPYAAAMRFLLLTLSRREEAGGARWRDIDIEDATWTLSATKNDEPHVVPLSRQALALLAERRPEKPKPAALVFQNSAGGPLVNWDRETKVIMEVSGTEKWSRHDLRRTAATMLGDMGELPDIVEAALNHVAIRSQIAATYNRSRYRPQVAAALQRLADALDQIEAKNTPLTQMTIKDAE
jgi:integrase